jgi:hypothetical protein
MTAKNLPENLPSPSSNDIRIELEGKIKSAEETIKWIIGILILILIACFGYIVAQLDKIDDLKQRITVLETKSGLNNIDDLKQRITVLETKFDFRQDASKEHH